MAGRRTSVAGRRLFVRAVAAAACVAAPVAGTSWAQQGADTSQISQAGVRGFDIAAQGLGEALIVFGRQSGLQVSVDLNVVRGLQTPGVRGRMTAQQALAALLAGTGLVYRASGSMVAVERPPAGSGAIQLDPVQVQGAFPVPAQAMIDNLPPPYAGGQVATGGQLGLLGNRDVMDTPFNQTSYTAKKAQEQQAKTVMDVLVDDPSVRVLLPGSTPGSDAISVRGFLVDTLDMAYGGLYGITPHYSIMAELAERVEVLKGPNAMLNGMQPRGGIGGTVNIVPKRAPEEPLTQATANYVSGSQFGGHADVARRFGEDKQFGVRVNGVFRAGQTDVKWNSDERALGVMGLDFRGEHARFSADFGFQYRYTGGVLGFIGLAPGVPLPWAPNARSNPAGQPWNVSEHKDLFGTFRAEVDLMEGVTAYVMGGAHDWRMNNLIAFGVNITDGSGAATGFAPNAQSYWRMFRTAEAGLRALADTGPIGHELAFTATAYDQTGGAASVQQGANFATNIYNPTVIARPNAAVPVSNLNSMQELSSLALADTLSAADKRIQLTVGARLQRVVSANYDATSGAQTSSYDQSALSPSVALVFKPWENVSVYGNWIQGLQPGITVGTAFANAGEVFAPYKSTQYEVGVKADWGKFTTTVSAFQISQPTTISVPGPSLPTLSLAGEQRNQGLEINVFGVPTEGVRLLGGAMFLSPVMTKTQGGLTDGWNAPFSPAFQFNLAGEWDLPYVRGLTLNGRVVYTGSQYVDLSYPRRSLPDWTRFDVGVRYAFDNPAARGKLLVARLNVENVLDANYWAGGIDVSALYLGAPRTFRLSLSADF
ncbi:TonB-dependent receptor [Reyranella sp.]|uniref:TonB-dependent receptor n=1 Tax=Reyranella sp. TaxID=1929291 RepID=UPI003BAAE5A1